MSIHVYTSNLGLVGYQPWWRRSRPLGIRVLAFGVPGDPRRFQGSQEGSIFGMLRDVRIFVEDISMYFILYSYYFIQTYPNMAWFFDRGWSNKILCYTRAGDYCGGVAQVFCRLFRTARCLAWSRRFEQVSFLEQMYRDMRDHKRDLNVTHTHTFMHIVYIYIFILYIYIYIIFMYEIDRGHLHEPIVHIALLLWWFFSRPDRPRSATAWCSEARLGDSSLPAAGGPALIGGNAFPGALLQSGGLRDDPYQ